MAWTLNKPLGRSVYKPHDDLMSELALFPAEPHVVAIPVIARPCRHVSAPSEREDTMRKCPKQQEAPPIDKVSVATCHRARALPANLPRLQANRTKTVVCWLARDPST